MISIDSIPKLPASALIGLVIGILLAAWVKPTTSAGIVFLIVVCVLVCTLLGVILGLFARRKS